MRYPSVPRVLVAALAEFGDTRTKLPADLHLAVPLIRIRRIGGADDRATYTDVSRVDVDVFHADDVAAEDLAEQIRDYLTAEDDPIEALGVVLDDVETEVAPVEIPYPEGLAAHYRATYRVTARPEIPE